jgi:hypothetical protein
MPFLRCQVPLAFLALAGHLGAQDAVPDMRERLDAVRRSVAPLNRELAGQRSPAITFALFGETRKQFADWQKLAEGTALEPTAAAVMLYVDDTGEALRSGDRDQAEFLLQQLDQLPPFLKDEIPKGKIAALSSDPVSRAAAPMVPLGMRLRAAFFALVDGKGKAAEQILLGATKPFAEWSALCQDTPFGKPAAAFSGLLEEAAGAFGKNTDPKRIQAMVDALNHGFEALMPALQRNRPAEAAASLVTLQAEWKRIRQEPDARLLAAVPLSSLPKDAPRTAPQALAQAPALRDALDEVYQTLWVTGRAAPSIESLDRFRSFWAEWRKPLDDTSAGPLIAAMTDSLGEAREFLDHGDVFSAQFLLRSLLGVLPNALKAAAARPPDDPFSKSAPLAIVRAQVMAVRSCLLRNPESANKLIRLSLQQSLSVAKSLDGTPQADSAAFLVGQLETLGQFLQDRNERATSALCAAITAKGLSFPPSDASERSPLNSRAPALQALAVWPALARSFSWEHSPELAQALMKPAHVQFDQWKTLCMGTSAQAAALAVWSLAADIRSLLAQDQSEAARLLAEAFGQRFSELEKRFASSSRDPRGSTGQPLHAEILEVYLRAIELALDPPDRAPHPKAALALARAAEHAQKTSLASERTEPLQRVLEEGWRGLSEALRKEDIAGARMLLDVVTRQTRLSAQSPSRTKDPFFPSEPRKTGGPYEITADEDLLANIVGTISRNHAVRICFEEIDLDPQKDAQTAADIIRQLEEKAGRGKLSPAEADRLDSARRIVKEHGPKVLFDSGAPRLTAKIRADSLDELLEKLTAGTRYAWRKVGSTFVVLPREGSVLDFPVTADVSNLTMQVAAQRIAGQRPSGGPIGLVVMTRGIRVLGKDPISLLQTRVPPLAFQDQSALEALCLLTESTDPAFTWHLAGYRQSRGLGVYTRPDNLLSPGSNPTRITPRDTYVLEYKDASMAELMARVRATFPERLCFEQAPTEALSAGETIQRLEEAARQVSPSEADRKLLYAARQAAQSGRDFDARARHSGRAAGATFEEFLDQLTRQTDYTWRKTGGAFVVFPLKGGLSQHPLTVTLPATTISEAVRRTLEEGTQQTKKEALVTFAEGVDPHAPVPARIFETGTVAEALCRITANSDAWWDLQNAGPHPEITLYAKVR